MPLLLKARLRASGRGYAVQHNLLPENTDMNIKTIRQKSKVYTCWCTSFIAYIFVRQVSSDNEKSSASKSQPFFQICQFNCSLNTCDSVDTFLKLQESRILLVLLGKARVKTIKEKRINTSFNKKSEFNLHFRKHISDSFVS